MNPKGGYPGSPRGSTDKALENQALLAWASSPDSDETRNQAQAQTQGKVRVPVRRELMTRNIEEIVSSDHLRLSLRNPYYELFLRKKALIVDDKGTVRCTQKGKSGSSSSLGGGIPVSAARGQPAVFSGMRATPALPSSYSKLQSIRAPIPAARNPNPNRLTRTMIPSSTRFQP